MVANVGGVHEFDGFSHDLRTRTAVFGNDAGAVFSQPVAVSFYCAVVLKFKDNWPFQVQRIVKFRVGNSPCVEVVVKIPIHQGTVVAKGNAVFDDVFVKHFHIIPLLPFTD